MATFLFKEVTSYDEAAALFEEPHTLPAWYALCWQKEDGTFENGGQNVVGFTDASGLFSTDLNYRSLTLVSFDSKKYPCLTQRSLEGNPAADAQTQHVCSMLRYADDRQKAFSLFRDAADRLPEDTFSRAARQTERHGLYVYGLVTEADGATLSRLAAWDNIAEMQIRESQPPVGP